MHLLRKPASSIVIYCLIIILSLLLPWWLAVPILLLPLPFIPFPFIAIFAGLIFDAIYGHSLIGFPFHTFRYTIIMICGVLIATLLKKVLRL